MAHEKLKELYKRFPDAWQVQARDQMHGHWVPLFSKPMWYTQYLYRLVPKLPEGLPEPERLMCNKAVYLGQGPIELPQGVRSFQGWAILQGRPWGYDSLLIGNSTELDYCISVDDPNFEAILRLNRPDLFANEEQ